MTEGLQLTPTEEIEGGVDSVVTVTVADPDLVASSVLVAVTVTLPAEAGAVKSPLAAMLPELTDQVTAEL
ncbi:MAG TPA: hypothetical protein VND66_06335 [Acidobacteriaceae bacterium]|nr:hypothetical protein [Terriglobia bacterium]HVC90224.1 hypothetical protein [Acidobacteriaceae bacterium]